MKFQPVINSSIQRWKVRSRKDKKKIYSIKPTISIAAKCQNLNIFNKQPKPINCSFISRFMTEEIHSIECKWSSKITEETTSAKRDGKKRSENLFFKSTAFVESSQDVLCCSIDCNSRRKCNGNLTLQHWNQSIIDEENERKSRTVLITDKKEIVENPTGDSSTTQQTNIDFSFPPSPYSVQSIFWLPAKMFVNFFSPFEVLQYVHVCCWLLCSPMSHEMNENLLIVFVKRSKILHP